MEEIIQLNLIKDQEHLKLLIIFHRIYGAIKIFFSLISIGYIFLFSYMLNNPKFFSNFPKMEDFPFPSSELIRIIMSLAIVMIIISCLTGIANFLSAQFIKQRENRTFSIIVACIDCVFLPFGTILGVFTLIVLFRNSIIELYNNTSIEV